MYGSLTNFTSLSFNPHHPSKWAIIFFCFAAESRVIDYLDYRLKTVKSRAGWYYMDHLTFLAAVNFCSCETGNILVPTSQIAYANLSLCRTFPKGRGRHWPSRSEPRSGSEKPALEEARKERTRGTSECSCSQTVQGLSAKTGYRARTQIGNTGVCVLGGRVYWTGRTDDRSGHSLPCRPSGKMDAPDRVSWGDFHIVW